MLATFNVCATSCGPFVAIIWFLYPRTRGPSQKQYSEKNNLHVHHISLLSSVIERMKRDWAWLGVIGRDSWKTICLYEKTVFEGKNVFKLVFWSLGYIYIYILYTSRHLAPCTTVMCAPEVRSHVERRSRKGLQQSQKVGGPQRTWGWVPCLRDYRHPWRSYFRVAKKPWTIHYDMMTLWILFADLPWTILESAVLGYPNYKGFWLIATWINIIQHHLWGDIAIQQGG